MSSMDEHELRDMLELNLSLGVAGVTGVAGGFVAAFMDESFAVMANMSPDDAVWVESE